jgi:hypothetical protein
MVIGSRAVSQATRLPKGDYIMELKLILTNYSLKINGRRYDRRTMTSASLDRLMNLINRLPSSQKSIEVEEDLSITLYVFMPRKPEVLETVEMPVAVMNAGVATELPAVTAPARRPLSRSVIISNFGDQIVIWRGDRVRTYNTFGRLATPGENRLYQWLKDNTELFDIEPFSFGEGGDIWTAMHSKVWRSK